MFSSAKTVVSMLIQYLVNICVLTRSLLLHPARQTSILRSDGLKRDENGDLVEAKEDESDADSSLTLTPGNQSFDESSLEAGNLTPSPEPKPLGVLGVRDPLLVAQSRYSISEKQDRRWGVYFDSSPGRVCESGHDSPATEQAAEEERVSSRIRCLLPGASSPFKNMARHLSRESTYHQHDRDALLSDPEVHACDETDTSRYSMDDLLPVSLRNSMDSSPTTPQWIQAADCGWKNEVALVMNAFRSCRTDDLTSLVPSISYESLEAKRRMSSEVQQVQEIEAWRNDLGSQDKGKRGISTTAQDVGYQATTRFHFP